MSRPESPLWQRLDACGIPFRETRRALVAAFGSRPCPWSDSWRECLIESHTPFLDILTVPLWFRVDERQEMDAHETGFTGYVRRHELAQDNFQDSLDALTAIFGQSVDISVSNTVTRRWQFGRASVSINIFKPSPVGFGVNSRHELDPGSETECSVDVDTGYFRPLSPEEKDALQSYEAHWKGGTDSSPAIVSSISRLCPDDFKPPLRGFGFDALNEFLIQSDEGVANLLPRVWITGVTYTVLLPARGGGGDFVAVKYKKPGEDTERSLALVQKFGAPKTLRACARRLAKHLNVEISESEGVDC